MNLILESLIDWPLVLSQPRYAGGHEQVMRNIFGKNAEVLDFWNEGDWQGTIAVAYKFSNGEVAIMTDYYGSCSGCDSWEDSSDTQARDMILGLCGSAKQFDSVELAKEWIKNIDSDKEPWHYPWQAAKNLKL